MVDGVNRRHRNVRFWLYPDTIAAPQPMSALGHKRTFFDCRLNVRFRG